MHLHLRISLHLAVALLKMTVIYGLVLCCVVYLCVWWSLPGGLNVQFLSSDGQWSRSEMLFKGTGLRQIAIGFEVYKLSCNAPTAYLQRLTPTPTVWSLDGWTEDLDDPKWQVPLVERTSAAGIKDQTTVPSCAERRLSAQDRLQVMQGAERWLGSLGGKR